MAILIKAASAPDIENPAVLDPLLETTGWKTLITIAQESGKFFELRLSGFFF